MVAFYTRKIPLDLPIPIRSLADAVLADERASFAPTSPAAAIRGLPRRAMSSTCEPPPSAPHPGSAWLDAPGHFVRRRRFLRQDRLVMVLSGESADLVMTLKKTAE